ncbi:MAG TPA: Stp1/IreP family PP2C-type Ser/Thr phosphatase [Gemmatimonadaceae bacterium]|nr:Stp1/IreP family PP2C-type Ser/Thr phosphatase [Gemmatimonadaceae bacterium]
MNEPNIVVHVYGVSDVGRTREHNEDAFMVADLDKAQPLTFPSEQTQVPGEHGTLFMVADGMGGAAAGEIASSMAVDVILSELRGKWSSGPGTDPKVFAVTLHDATEVANDRIHEYASEHPENRGMGTTATVAGILGDTLYIAQVGDSRAYLMRQGEVRQLTKDQSLMQRLIEAGEITAEEAEVSERRNIILQALGPEAAIKVDITHQQLRRGDVLVLCSDGLSGVVRDHEIQRVARESSDLVTLCHQLISLANESGGPDNITVVAARFEGEGLVLPTDGDAVGHQTFAVGETTPVTPHPRLEVSAPTPPRDELTEVLNAAPPAADHAAFPSLQPTGVRRALTPADIDAARAALGAGAAEANGPPPKGRKRRAAVLIVAVAAIVVLVYGLVTYLRTK